MIKCVADFRPLAVGVVYAVVKGDLIPLLRHFKEMILAQLSPQECDLSLGGPPEIMGQGQLFGTVAFGPYQLLADLDQNPSPVVASCCPWLRSGVSSRKEMRALILSEAWSDFRDCRRCMMA